MRESAVTRGSLRDKAILLFLRPGTQTPVGTCGTSRNPAHRRARVAFRRAPLLASHNDRALLNLRTPSLFFR